MQTCGFWAPVVLWVIQAGLLLRPAPTHRGGSVNRSHTGEKLLNGIKTGLADSDVWVNSNNTVCKTMNEMELHLQLLPDSGLAVLLGG